MKMPAYAGIYIYMHMGYICNVYTVFSRAISNNIAPKPRHFFVRGQPLNRGIFSSEAVGRGRKNAEVEGLAEDEKMPRLRGYIVGYSTRRHRIYNIYPLNMFKYSSKYFGICVQICPDLRAYMYIYAPNSGHICRYI